MASPSPAGPALPWATATAAAAPVAVEVEGVCVGECVEVKWQIVEEDGSNRTVKWWSATIAERLEGQTDGEGRQVYMLRYAADPEAGFDEEASSRVIFLGGHHLYDLGEEEELPWRHQGEAWESGGEEEQDDRDVVAAATAAAAGQGFLEIGQVVEAIREGERRRGKTVEEECRELLHALPVDQQRVVAAGFREFSDTLTEGIKSLYQQNGPEYIIQAEDIYRIRAEAMSRLGQGLFHGGP